MKKILMILAAILALGSLTAKAQMRSGVDTLTLDQVKYRITYDAKQVNDTTEMPYIYRKCSSSPKWTRKMIINYIYF